MILSSSVSGQRDAPLFPTSLPPSLPQKLLLCRLGRCDAFVSPYLVLSCAVNVTPPPAPSLARVSAAPYPPPAPWPRIAGSQIASRVCRGPDESPESGPAPGAAVSRGCLDQRKGEATWEGGFAAAMEGGNRRATTLYCYDTSFLSSKLRALHLSRSICLRDPCRRADYLLTCLLFVCLSVPPVALRPLGAKDGCRHASPPPLPPPSRGNVSALLATRLSLSIYHCNVLYHSITLS